MSNQNIKEELKEVAPRLASIKDHVTLLKMPEGYVDALYAQAKPKNTVGSNTKTRYINVAMLTGIAASFIFLVICFGLNNSQPENLPIEQVESFVASNFDDYEEFFDEESLTGADWISLELEDIPENQLISYIESNLDQIDLENFIPIK